MVAPTLGELNQLANRRGHTQCTYEVTGHVLIGVCQQAVPIVLHGNTLHVSNAGELAVAHRTSAVDACYMEAYRLAGLRTPSRLHSVDGLPWFTFLRFFGGFAGASELVALGLLFAGEWALDTSLSGATLSLSVSLDSAMLSGEAPFDRRAASVIKCG